MNKVQKEILDAIDIIVDKKMKQYSTQILFGVVESVGNDNLCVVSINTIGYNIRYYGDIAPTVNKKYPVFVPASGMSNAFLIGDCSAITFDEVIKAIGYTPGMTNPNLMDNPWFQINQRGETVYTTTGYTVDRWRLNTKTDANASITVKSDGVQLYATGGTWLNCDQPIEFPERLNGKTVTLSIDTNAEYLKSIELKNLTTNKVFLSISVGSTNGRKIISKSVNIPSDEISADDTIGVGIFMTGSSADEVCSAMVYAVKLEQGSVSTLAYDIAPNYEEQLIRCQRYFQRFNIAAVNNPLGLAVARSSTTAAVMFNLMSAMRTHPTMECTATFKLLGNVTKTALKPVVENAYFNMVRLNFATSGLTANEVYFAAADSTGYMDFSSDL